MTKKVKVRLVRSCRFSAGGEFYKLGDEFEIEEHYADQYSDMLERVEDGESVEVVVRKTTRKTKRNAS